MLGESGLPRNLAATTGNLTVRYHARIVPGAGDRDVRWFLPLEWCAERSGVLVTWRRMGAIYGSEQLDR